MDRELDSLSVYTIQSTWSILRGLNLKASIHIINRMFIEF